MFCACITPSVKWVYGPGPFPSTSLCGKHDALCRLRAFCALGRRAVGERLPEYHILTHPDFTKLPGPKLPDQLERLPGDFPLILGPGVLGGQAHTGLGQPLAQPVPFLCIRKEEMSWRSQA